jgi:SAM-dependent methyltransferase
MATSDSPRKVQLDAAAQRWDVALLSHFKRWLLVSDSRLLSLLRRPLWKLFYSMTCRNFLPEGYTNFMNLGYLSGPSDVGPEDNPNIADRVSERLYEQVVGDADLVGRTVVEVGCGAGAGSAHLARAYQPASLLGIDLNKNLIAWCCEHYDAANLQFRQGDAQSLPIASGGVDAVVNVESSHCYPSRLRFFEEVVRVLRPGGVFLFADLLFPVSGEGSDAVSAQLSDAGLIIQDRIEITENVLAARDAVSGSRFRSRIREEVPSREVPFYEEGFFLSGTRSYASMVSGEVQYFQWRALKPSGSSAGSRRGGA